METKERDYYHSLYEMAAAVNSALAPDSVLYAIAEHVAKAAGGRCASDDLKRHESAQHKPHMSP